jgi:two-component system LytT family response regulator
MNECRILIADDEALARKAIRHQLTEFPDIILAETSNGKDTLEHIIRERPHIVFLDIQMPMGTGLQVLEKLPEDYQPYIIIVTAYDEYALQAFDHDAIDYLLKPFTDDRFRKAFNKAYQLWKRPQTASADPQLAKRLKDVIDKLQPARNTLTIKDASKLIVLSLDDVLYIEADGEYLGVHTSTKKYLHRESLSQLENNLPINRFVRIHKSSIVNTAYIKELHSHFNGDYTVLLTNGKTLKLSRHYRQRLIELLG